MNDLTLGRMTRTTQNLQRQTILFSFTMILKRSNAGHYLVVVACIAVSLRSAKAPRRVSTSITGRRQQRKLKGAKFNWVLQLQHYCLGGNIYSVTEPEHFFFKKPRYIHHIVYVYFFFFTLFTQFFKKYIFFMK